MKFNFFIIRIILFCFFIQLISKNTNAQSGAWNPANADLSFPRTLLKASEIAAVQASLQDSIRFRIFQGVYQSANTVIPAGNTTIGEKRVRSTLAKNAAFILLLYKKPLAGNVSSLATAEADSLKTKVIKLLNEINTNVEAISLSNPGIYTEWQWRSKELIDYIIAYDLLKGANVSDTELTTAKANLQTFAGNLHKESNKTFFGMNFFGNVKNNHALMTAAALGISAVVLNDATSTDADKQPLNWINTALWNIDNILWRDKSRQSEPNIIAGYAEGPYYLKYAFLNVLPFNRAIGNFLPDSILRTNYNSTLRFIRNPYFDQNYDNLYEWIIKIQLPDAKIPAIADTYVDEYFPELALTGKQKYNVLMQSNKIAAPELYNNELVSNVDMRANYLAANVPFSKNQPPLFESLPASGDLVFRSSQDPSATYMHVLAKNGTPYSSSGGHNQTDVSSFIIYHKGEILALDPGYLSFDRRTEVGNATDHNMILVDSAGPAIGTAGNPNSAPGFIKNTFSLSGMSFGEVQTSYFGANIKRNFLFIRNKYFLVADLVSSAKKHDYQWQLHGNGLLNGTAQTGLFYDSLNIGRGTWEKNGRKLLVQITAGENTSYNISQSEHEVDYNKEGFHTRMIAAVRNTDTASFASALITYDSVLPPYQVNNLSLSNAHGISVTNDLYNDYLITKNDTQLVALGTGFSTANDTFSTDAQVNYVSTDKNKRLQQLFLGNVSFWQFSQKLVISTFQRMNIAYAFLNDTLSEGHVSAAGIVRFPIMAGVPINVSGQNITSWSFDKVNQQVIITFSGASEFKVNSSEIITGIEKRNNRDFEKSKASEIIDIYSSGYQILVNYEVACPGSVQLELYDIFGRKVYFSEKIYSNTGKASITINSEKFASGIYVCVLSVNGVKADVRKVVVAR